MRNKLIASILALAILTTGCVYDSEESLYGTPDCQTDDVTYSGVVLPLIENSCMGCHSANANFGGITLEGYDNLKVYVDNGLLIGAIRHDSGFSPMPQGAPKFVDCNIEKIEAWINEGAPDN